MNGNLEMGSAFQAGMNSSTWGSFVGIAMMGAEIFFCWKGKYA